MIADAEGIANGRGVFTTVGDVLFTSAANAHEAHRPELSTGAAFDVNRKEGNPRTSGVRPIKNDSRALINGMTHADTWNQALMRCSVCHGGQDARLG